MMKALLGLGVVLAVIGGLFVVEERYAKSEEVRQIGRRLDIKIAGDVFQGWLMRSVLWEELYGANCATCNTDQRKTWSLITQQLKQAELDLLAVQATK